MFACVCLHSTCALCTDWRNCIAPGAPCTLLPGLRGLSQSAEFSRRPRFGERWEAVVQTHKERPDQYFVSQQNLAFDFAVLCLSRGGAGAGRLLVQLCWDWEAVPAAAAVQGQVKKGERGHEFGQKWWVCGVCIKMWIIYQIVSFFDPFLIFTIKLPQSMAKKTWRKDHISSSNLWVFPFPLHVCAWLWPQSWIFPRKMTPHYHTGIHGSGCI